MASTRATMRMQRAQVQSYVCVPSPSMAAQTPVSPRTMRPRLLALNERLPRRDQRGVPALRTVFKPCEAATFIHGVQGLCYTIMSYYKTRGKHMKLNCTQSWLRQGRLHREGAVNGIRRKGELKGGDIITSTGLNISRLRSCPWQGGICRHQSDIQMWSVSITKIFSGERGQPSETQIVAWLTSDAHESPALRDASGRELILCHHKHRRMFDHHTVTDVPESSSSGSV